MSCTVKVLSDIPTVKLIVTYSLMGYTPFTLKYTGDSVLMTYESEDKIPEGVKPYVLKAEPVVKNDGKK